MQSICGTKIQFKTKWDLRVNQRLSTDSDIIELRLIYEQ